MTTYTWSGVSAPFTAPSFWSVNGTINGGLPGTVDVALFGGTTAYAVSAASSVDLLAITDPSATVTLAGSATIGFSGAGGLANSGTLIGGDLAIIGTATTAANLGSFVNTGTIAMPAGARLVITANTSTPLLGAIGMNGGTIDLGGAIDNSGATLSAAQFGAGGLMVDGSVTGGTIRNDGGVVFGPGHGETLPTLLNGVALQGDFHLDGKLYVAGGLTVTDLSGSSSGSLAVSGDQFGSGILFVLDSETLDNFTLTLSGLAQSGQGGACRSTTRRR